MVTRHLLAGLGSALQHWRLVVLLWLWHLCLAIVVSVPTYLWFLRALGPSPEAVNAMTGFDATILAELMERDSSTLRALVSAAFCAGTLAAIGALFISGGMLQVLFSRRFARGLARGETWQDAARAPLEPGHLRSDPDNGRGVMRGFFCGAGRYFWRMLRLFLLTAIPAGLAIGVIVAALRLVVKPLAGTTSELIDWIRMLLPIVGLALGVLAFLLVFDFSRVALVATDDRRARQACWMGLRFVYRHAWRVVLLWLALFLLGALGLGLFLLFSSPLNGTSWVLIALLVVLQQLLVLWRATIRVALGAGQIEQAIAFGLPGAEGVR